MTMMMIIIKIMMMMVMKMVKITMIMRTKITPIATKITRDVAGILTNLGKRLHHRRHQPLFTVAQCD